MHPKNTFNRVAFLIPQSPEFSHFQNNASVVCMGRGPYVSQEDMQRF